MAEFTHLHCHTQYSLLDGFADIDAYMRKAKEDGMKGLAITDHGNMFGVFKFWDSAQKHGLKPIIGCEFYLVDDRHIKEFKNGKRDKRYHQLILAKNAEGYKNISKLTSLGFIEGYYSKYPRIDKELIRKYKDGLIATTSCVAAEVPQTFYEKGAEEAEKVFLEWLEIFGEDYYIELQRHGLRGIDQEAVNQFLISMAQKYGVKIIGTNDSHYVDQEDWLAQDILLCLNTGDFQNVPVGENKGEQIRVQVKGKWEYDTPENLLKKYPSESAVRDIIRQLNENNRKRFGFENDQFYFKKSEEMAALFHDVPEAIENTMEIFDKIDTPRLQRDVLLPNYTLPEGYESQDDYLYHLSFERAEKKYGEITAEVRERLEYELKVIRDMGFAGYFLIVQDFIEAARKQNVRVGPGRGSAAGSAVAYVIGITDIDPIRYNLLFERFLNPERISMPDIDIDFDDAGRQKVIDYVVEKYGRNQVAQIITYGTMASRSSVRDVGRVLQYPLSDTDRLAKMIPDTAKNLKSAFKENKELGLLRKEEEREPGKVLKLAEKLEGSIRQRGIHAAGVIIAPDDLTNFIPVCTSPESELLVTQYDGKYIESAGMLKMDFLGLKTLSIINDALELIKTNRGLEIDIDRIDLDDEKTLELYQKGETIGTFQFESDGMRKWLKLLKPTNIEDLIAMNALYRPGPMDYIPNYINRKHGKEKTEFPHPLLEEILAPTHGIMVYQEQIMQTAQIIGGFSLGKADVLRRAMGKKKIQVMQEMKEEFIAGAVARDIDPKQAEEIFSIMEKFAQYGFNRSHAAAYTMLAFQTAWLKANYPAEYIASVLTHNMSDIKKLTFFLDEARHMGIRTLGPDINESRLKFTVNAKGEIRYALAGIKGVGEAAVEAIISERDKNGPYENIFDLTKRVNLRALNKKSLESLAKAGAFDCFGEKRSRYFACYNDNSDALERAVRFGSQYQQQVQSSQNSLFGEEVMTATLLTPELPVAPPWHQLELLEKEKEVTGIYLSGHPLDDFSLELKWLCTPIEKLPKFKNKTLRIGGMVKSRKERMTKRGQKFGLFEVEDFTGSHSMALFKEEFFNFWNMLEEGNAVLITGTYRDRNERRDGYEEHWELSPSKVELLSEARERYVREVMLDIHISDIEAGKVEELVARLEENRGNIPLKIRIVDTEKRSSLQTSCSKYLIDVNTGILEYFDNTPEYRLIIKS